MLDAVVGAGRHAERIDDVVRRDRTIARTAVEAPFIHVADHVVETERIGQIGSHDVRGAARVDPGIPVHAAVAVTPGNRRFGARDARVRSRVERGHGAGLAGELPLGICRQVETDARPFAQHAQEGRRVDLVVRRPLQAQARATDVAVRDVFNRTHLVTGIVVRHARTIPLHEFPLPLGRLVDAQIEVVGERHLVQRLAMGTFRETGNGRGSPHRELTAVRRNEPEEQLLRLVRL